LIFLFSITHYYLSTFYKDLKIVKKTDTASAVDIFLPKINFGKFLLQWEKIGDHSQHNALIIKPCPIGMDVEPLKEIAKTMNKELPINFIKEKIEEIQTALFFPENNSLSKFQSHLIKAHTDEEGKVCFTINMTSETFDLANPSFPCKLEFYKKGVGFYIQVLGQATIDEGRTENGPSSTRLKHSSKNQEIPVKVTIEKMNYQPIPPESAHVKSKEGINSLVNWLFKAKTSNRNEFMFKPKYFA